METPEELTTNRKKLRMLVRTQISIVDAEKSKAPGPGEPVVFPEDEEDQFLDFYIEDCEQVIWNGEMGQGMMNTFAQIIPAMVSHAQEASLRINKSEPVVLKKVHIHKPGNLPN